MEPTPDETLLTAYLDGELTPEERKCLEQRLADEPELRQRLTLLEETWYYLDLLEHESADSAGIEATLEIAAVSLSAIPFLPPAVSRWIKRGTVALSGAVLFASSFYVGTWTDLTDPSILRTTEEHQRLAAALGELTLWEKEDLLIEEPQVIIDALKQSWNEH